MNRAARRKFEKKSPLAKKKYALTDVQRAVGISLRMNETTKGHLYKDTMNGHCVFCGATQKARKRCDYWFATFLDRMQVTLINPQFYADSDDNAKWFQHGDEYAEVKVTNVKN